MITVKKPLEHPDHATYLAQWSSLYQDKNYDDGLTGYFLAKSHEWSEAQFGPEAHFAQVLEIGAGTGMHLKYVKHGFEQYYVTDLNPPMLDQLKIERMVKNGRAQVIVQAEDATSLSFADASFDRVIAAHVLEHLYRPHEVLAEWHRVLRPGGVLTLVLPCDPGLAWRFGRTCIARRKFVSAGLDYDYWMAREHVNPINNLVSFVRHYFHDVQEGWFPLRIPSIDLNLFYIAHIKI